MWRHTEKGGLYRVYNAYSKIFNFTLNVKYLSRLKYAIAYVTEDSQ